MSFNDFPSLSQYFSTSLTESEFEVDAIIELQTEFRTSESSGVLLSISGGQGSPSLSVELHNGKVILSSDFGYSQILRVEQDFTNPYTICDNRWHKVQAVINNEELMLRVDELDQKYVSPDKADEHFFASSIVGSLYIGGVPGTILALIL